MKKKGLLIFGFLTTILSGCGGKNSKVSIYYKDMSLTTFITLDSESKLSEKIENKENFILASYSSETCSCWGQFRDSVLTPFVRESKVPVYVISKDKLVQSYHGLPYQTSGANSPIFGIYENGVYKVGTDYLKSEVPFKKLADFKVYIDRYIKYPKMTYVNLDYLNNTLLKGTTPFLINWSYAICPDCKAFDDKFMVEYLKKTKDSFKLPYYIIETESIGLRLNESGERDTPFWQAKKDLYGLSNALNTTYGYSTGYVPTLQIIEPNGTDYVALGDISPIISDMFVFQNESLVKEGNEVKVSESYFNGVRGIKYIGEYASEIGTVISEDDYYLDNSGNPKLNTGARYDVNAKYAKKFLDHYWL